MEAGENTDLGENAVFFVVAGGKQGPGNVTLHHQAMEEKIVKENQ